MFDISGWEFLTLAVLAVILFGPEKLPGYAADAGKFIRAMRGQVEGAKAELARELGPEIDDLKISDLTPRGLLRKTLGDDPFEGIQKDLDLNAPPKPPATVPLATRELPPWDPEST